MFAYSCCTQGSHVGLTFTSGPSINFNLPVINVWLVISEGAIGLSTPSRCGPPWIWAVQIHDISWWSHRWVRSDQYLRLVWSFHIQVGPNHGAQFWRVLAVRSDNQKWMGVGLHSRPRWISTIRLFRLMFFNGFFFIKKKEKPIYVCLCPFYQI